MKVRPRGWGFLIATALCADAAQFFLTLVSALLTPIFSMVFSGAASIFLSIFFFCIRWIWHVHNDLPSKPLHAITPMIGEMIPFVNLLPFWTLYALTYWVEEEEPVPYWPSAAETTPTPQPPSLSPEQTP